MRIAVPYDKGQVFQHFGRTEEFKVYEVADGLVTDAEVVASEGADHGALASRLAELQVDVVVCGGVGGGARQALAEAGIGVCSGAAGSADEAVAAYLTGSLNDGGETCGCHHGADEACSCGDDGEGCGGGCGHCGGGCGGAGLTGPNVGRRVRVHYRGTLNDGTQFDSSYDRGEPLEFVCGAGMMIRGFDAAVAEMAPGAVVDVHLMPEEAYGPVDPAAVFTLPIARLPGSEALEVGQQVYLTGAYGQPFPVKVAAKDEVNITLDANHEMAGKELNFRIELVEIC